MSFKVGDRVRFVSPPYSVGSIVKEYPSSVHYDMKSDEGALFVCLYAHDIEHMHTYQLPVSAYQSNYSLMSDYSGNSNAADYFNQTDEKLKAERKERGECERCGKLRPMSIHGLLDCPDHPTPLPPDFKQ